MHPSPSQQIYRLRLTQFSKQLNRILLRLIALNLTAHSHLRRHIQQRNRRHELTQLRYNLRIQLALRIHRIGRVRGTNRLQNLRKTRRRRNRHSSRLRRRRRRRARRSRSRSFLLRRRRIRRITRLRLGVAEIRTFESEPPDDGTSELFFVKPVVISDGALAINERT